MDKKLEIFHKQLDLFEDLLGDIEYLAHECKEEFEDTHELCNAVKSGNYDLVKSLIEEGADVNAQNKFGRTPLGFASEYGYKEICELLIEKGADVNLPNEDTRTPLMESSSEGNEEICKLLIENGADVNAKDDGERTPLMYGAENGHKDICKILIENGADINANDEEGRTALMIVIECKNRTKELLLNTEYLHADSFEKYDKTIEFLIESNYN